MFKLSGNGLGKLCVNFIVNVCNDGKKMKTKSNNANGMLKYRLSDRINQQNFLFRSTSSLQILSFVLSSGYYDSQLHEVTEKGCILESLYFEAWVTSVRPHYACAVLFRRYSGGFVGVLIAIVSPVQ
jgi:hypothetical protein